MPGIKSSGAYASSHFNLFAYNYTTNQREHRDLYSGDLHKRLNNISASAVLIL